MAPHNFFKTMEQVSYTILSSQGEYPEFLAHSVKRDKKIPSLLEVTIWSKKTIQPGVGINLTPLGYYCKRIVTGKQIGRAHV